MGPQHTSPHLHARQWGPGPRPSQPHPRRPKRETPQHLRDPATHAPRAGPPVPPSPKGVPAPPPPSPGDTWPATPRGPRSGTAPYPTLRVNLLDAVVRLPAAPDSVDGAQPLGAAPPWGVGFGGHSPELGTGLDVTVGSSLPGSTGLGGLCPLGPAPCLQGDAVEGLQKRRFWATQSPIEHHPRRWAREGIRDPPGGTDTGVSGSLRAALQLGHGGA